MPSVPLHNHQPGTVCGETCPVWRAQNGIRPGGDEPPQMTVLTAAGKIIEDPARLRLGIVGPAGMQAEVTLDPAGYHGVITVLGGRNLAACGFPPKMLREHAEHCMRAAAEIERRHGR